MSKKPKCANQEKKARQEAALAACSGIPTERLRPNIVGEMLGALKMHMEWIGPPPTDKESFDSLREDAWRLGTAVLAKMEGV